MAVNKIELNRNTVVPFNAKELELNILEKEIEAEQLTEFTRH